MESLVFAVAVGLCLAPIANAGKTVQWDIQKNNHRKVMSGKRATSTYSEVITNEVARGGYFATCAVGTPSQNMTMQLDTGSSDIWVPWSSALLCEEYECSLGTFNPDNSSTYKDAGKGEFQIAYVDGSYSKGDYFTDTFDIAGATISNVTMGLGKSTTIAYGLVGVGYKVNEAIVGTEDSVSAAYPNLPVVMVNEGLIATNAYSLWLNDLDSSTGSILFGGIDTEKYTGNLTKINIIQDPETQLYDSFLVQLTSIQAVSSSGTDELTSRDFPVEVVLDSGTTLTYIPTDLAEQVWTEVGAVYLAEVGMAVLPCSMQVSQGSFSFGFSGSQGPRISVTMDELVLDLVTSGPAPTFSAGQYEGEEACAFGIQNSSSDPFLLGDTFLRSAYVVYDLVNNQIGMAQTDFNATASNIVAFESHGAQIPFATLASNQSLATSTSTFTEPAYVAESGFANGTQDSGSMTVPRPGWEPLAVGGAAMLVSLFGGGLFLV
ncbi:hypothetical protein VSDG_06913 [Cytospora chrysosperma]|uniref:Probable aspartic-type endopeptidase OPSB n=1 Tax=Cytospora chrysosperma TaxID=252740 RepID=A0A423VQH6_CYTCH|nr:hypothetical protein VSDG_06913 [Valsa sordida]